MVRRERGAGTTQTPPQPSANVSLSPRGRSDVTTRDPASFSLRIVGVAQSLGGYFLPFEKAQSRQTEKDK